MRSDFHSCLRHTNNTVSCCPETREAHITAAVQKSVNKSSTFTIYRKQMFYNKTVKNRHRKQKL